jgi:hypothetical protein
MLSPTMVLVFLTALWISIFVYLDAQLALILAALPTNDVLVHLGCRIPLFLVTFLTGIVLVFIPLSSSVQCFPPKLPLPGASMGRRVGFSSALSCPEQTVIHNVVKAESRS